MYKNQFLIEKNVRDFIDYMCHRIDTTGVFNHFYTTRKLPIQNWSCNSIYNAYENYCWPVKSSAIPDFLTLPENFTNLNNFKQSDFLLNYYKINLLNSLQTNNPEKFKIFCNLVFKWGGVANGNSDFIAGINQIVSYFNDNISILSSPNLNINFSSNTIDISGVPLNFRNIKMNSGFTKVYSLLIDDFIIYDTRVAAALGFLVRDFLLANNVKTIPHELNFAWAHAKGSISSRPNRNPGLGSTYQFKKLSTSKIHVINNIKSNWLLAKVAQNSRFNSLNNPLRALEAALFMIGYEIPS